MTMKHITLPLADDTTETKCGACRHLGGDDGLVWCEQPAFAPPDDGTDDQCWPEVWDGLRIAECVEAEASHASLIRDAEAWRRVRSAVLTADRQRSIAAIVTGELER